jgi:hypothetical protein
MHAHELGEIVYGTLRQHYGRDNKTLEELK